MSREDVERELEENPLPQKRFNEVEEEIDGRERTLLEAAARLYADAEAAERDLENYRENKPSEDVDADRAGAGTPNEPLREDVGDDKDGTVDPTDAKPDDEGENTDAPATGPHGAVGGSAAEDVKSGVPSDDE